jgi:hypothetical protein
MASIKNYEGFEIKITPEYVNWWSYYIEFMYKDKPLFNPELMRADQRSHEYSSWALLPILEKAIECTTPDEKFEWNEWEDESAITIQYKKINTEATDGFFVFEAFLSSFFFSEGSSNTMDQPAGLRLMILERDELKKFYNDLKLEMATIVHSLVPQREISGSQPIEETQTIKMSNLNVNMPIKHGDLPLALINRIKNFKQMLGDMDPTSLEGTLENFRRDTNPEKEIAIWESIATVYKDTVSKNSSMTFEEKRNVYRDLLARSMETNPIKVTRTD